jgi:hypothetical protein
MNTATTIQTLIRAEFACTDASCAPPPVGTGGSVPSAGSLRPGKGFGRLSAVPGARTPVSPGRGIDKDAFDLPSRSESLARSIWDNKLPSGASSKVMDVQSRWNGATQTGTMKVKGQIESQDGRVLATFERDLVYEGDTERLHVKHEYLSTMPDQKFTGVGSEFNRASVNQYRSAGVDYIEVDAGMSVGGYNWAREGFRVEARRNEWTGKMESRHEQISTMSKYARDNIDRVVGTDPNIPYAKGREIIVESKRRLAAVVAASKAGEDVQPIHIASIGEDDMRFTSDKGYETWPGKEMLLGQAWHGTYYFDANRAVTAAAAFVCEHGSLVAACYDASCRPPTSGGTGGSSKRGYKVSPSAGDKGDVMPDVRLAGVRVTYDPDYPDGGPDPGEVVWAKIPFEDDPTQSKDRPVLVIGRVEGSTRLAAVQLTSQIKGRGWELPIGSGTWDRSGKPSAINMGRIVQIGAKNYRREGSKFDEKKFDAVIGRLAAYHRTPVNRAVTAAAALLAAGGYNPAQPRDREGRWTAHRGTLTSLSQQSLDRAITRGVEGIFGGSPMGTTPWPRAPRLKGEKLYDQARVNEALRKPPVLEKVDPRTLFAIQPGLVREHVEYYMGDTYSRTGRTAADQSDAANDFPLIYVNKREQHIILTGHHRAAAALIKGEDLDARVVREVT